MSRTDRHRPIDVALKDPYNRRYVQEIHRHEKSICNFDLDWVDDRRRSCHLWPAPGAWGKLVSKKCRKTCACRGWENQGRVRMYLTGLKRKLLTSSREDLWDVDTSTNNRYIRHMRRNPKCPPTP